MYQGDIFGFVLSYKCAFGCGVSAAYYQNFLSSELLAVSLGAVGYAFT
jgi:hypothetical protein